MRSQWTQNGDGDLRTDTPPLRLSELMYATVLLMVLVLAYGQAAQWDEASAAELQQLAEMERARLALPPAVRDAYESERADQVAASEVRP